MDYLENPDNRMQCQSCPLKIGYEEIGTMRMPCGQFDCMVTEERNE